VRPELTFHAMVARIVGLHRGRRIIVLLAGLTFLVAWQSSFMRADAKIDPTYHVWASTGVHWEPQFFFFLYHLGITPLKTDAPIRADTRSEAERLLHNAPDMLKQDEWVTFRSGDRGRVYLYYVDKLLAHGDARTPKLRPAHALAWIVALSGLWFAMWWSRRAAFGATLVVLLGSNPFQLHSVYGEENVFSWPITVMVMLLAIHVPLMGTLDPTKRLARIYPWIAAVLSAFTMASVRCVRSEPLPVILGAVFVYITLSNTRWWKRIALVAVLGISLTLFTNAYTKHFERKFHESQKVLVDLGVEPYTGPYRVYHEVWHAIFCGLGDFDTKHGYLWNDLKAYMYVYPWLQKWHPDLPLNPRSAPQTFYYDNAKKYPVYYGEVDERYHDLVRDKILGDIKHDPWWFVDIIKKRIWRVLTDTTPVTIALHDQQFETKSPFWGLFSLPLLGLLYVSRRWFLLRLLCFSVPLAVPALMIFSDFGMAHYSCMHIFGAAIFLSIFAQGFRRWWRSRSE
jgi:hypothetical protein